MLRLAIWILGSAGIAAAQTPIRVNAGGGVYNDPQGQVWAADTGYSGGITFSVSTPIAGTATPNLYQSERWNSGAFQYQFAVANGNYNVKLKFAEIYFTSAGQRSFNVAINGNAVLTNFDIVAQAGASDTAIDRTFGVNVTGGQVTIQFTPVLSNPKVSAIEIVPQAVDVGVSPTQTFLSPGQTQQFTGTVVGTGTTGVTWSISPAGVGSVSSTGLYTAPAGLTRQTVTVTATSTADNTKAASAAVVLGGAWQGADVGAVYQPGSSNIANGAFSVVGAGDINGAADAFRFVSQSFNGDGSITARFNSAEACCLKATKAGVMFRASAAPDAPHVFLSIFSGIVGLLESRSTAGGATAVTFGGAGVFWVKLTRTGNTFSGFISAEGVSWIPVGSPVTIAGMPGAALVGLAVSSGDAPTHSVVFDNVNVSGPVTVSVDQTLVSLGPSQQAQFTATVWNGVTGAVNWSVSPAGAGSITAGGLYTAPASIATPTTVTVTATSAEDGTKSSRVVVSLGAFQTIRVNGGGPSHYDPTGTFWTADTGASGGVPFSNGTPIPNTQTPYLYQSEHFAFGSFAYAFYVPNGSYQVKLKFAEIYFTAAGQRVFHVALNGTQVLTNFDVFVQAGGAFKAYDQVFPVTVTNGQIVIQFTQVTSNPKVNAIEITAGLPGTFQITDFNPKAGPAGTLVSVVGSGLLPNAGTTAQVTMAKQGGGSVDAPVATVTATQLSFVVPTGASSGTVSVKVNNNTGNTPAPFTVMASSGFTMSTLPAAITLVQGQTAAIRVTLTSTTGFSQLASLNVSGLPAGITGAFKPQAISAGQTAVLTLSAPAGQGVGTSSITISATASVDGLQVGATGPASVTVIAPTTSFVGRTVVSDALETPLAGVTVTMLGKNGSGGTTACSGSTVSDAAGNFALRNLPAGCAGAQLVGFDGQTATSPTGKYAGVNLVYTFGAGQVTASPVLVHLPRIDNQETFLVQQNWPSTQKYSYSSVPGLTVEVYANTIFQMPDGSTPNPFPLVAVQVPIDRLPDAKPPVPTMVIAFIVAFQPANVKASQPVAVSYPNTLNDPAGFSMSLMTLV